LISGSTLKNGKFLPNEETGKEFIQCIQYVIKKKQYIGDKLLNDTTGNFARYAWFLERKFSEWNLKHISENINRNENETIINITANSEAQRKLIDDLINVDFVEIKPAQLPATNNDIEDELPFNDNTNNSI
jgi:hypothetical protein